MWTVHARGSGNVFLSTSFSILFYSSLFSLFIIFIFNGSRKWAFVLFTSSICPFSSLVLNVCNFAEKRVKLLA